MIKMDFTNISSVDQATASILNVLQGILESIATFFGVSVSFIQEHFHEYLLLYGRYEMATNVIKFIILGCVFLGCTLILHAILKSVTWTYTEDSVKASTIKCITISLTTISLIIMLSGVAYNVVRYAAFPEAYSVNAILDAFSSSDDD